MLINGAGAVATAATLVVEIVSKFTEGAWITVLAIPALLTFFRRVRGHEEWIRRQLRVAEPLPLDPQPPPLVVVPIKRLDRLALKALRIAMSISQEVEVVQVFAEDPEMEDIHARWCDFVVRPARAAGREPPALVCVKSPYREHIGPLLRHVRRLTRGSPKRYVAVVVPELVEHRWYHVLLHSPHDPLLAGLLLIRGGPRVIVISTPWYLRDDRHGRGTGLDEWRGLDRERAAAKTEAGVRGYPPHRPLNDSR